MTNVSFILTCGRGLESHTIDEVTEKIPQCSVSVISEGKIAVHVTVKSTEEIPSQNYDNFDQDSNSFLETFSTTEHSSKYEKIFSSLFKIKLIEKLYLLIYYKNLENCSDCDCSEEVCEKFQKISWSNANKISEFLTKYDQFEPTLQCVDRSTCSALSKRSDELRKRKLKREEKQNSRKRKRVTKFEVGNAGGLTDDTKNNVNIDVHSVKTSDSISLSEIEGREKVTAGDDVIYFRVSCRITGGQKKIADPKTLTRKLYSICTTQNKNWKSVDILTSSNFPFVDIFVNLTDCLIFIGCCLVKKPLSLRPYIRHITLRSTICHLMLRLANVAESGTLLDPMCGNGAILAEAVHCFKLGVAIGCDVNHEQLNGAFCNLRDSPVAFDLIHCDVADLSFKSNSIDAVVCDFPFGAKYKSENKEDKILFAKLMEKCGRWLKINCSAVFLLSAKQGSWMEDEELLQLYENPDGCQKMKLMSKHFLTLGLTPANVCRFMKL